VPERCKLFRCDTCLVLSITVNQPFLINTHLCSDSAQVIAGHLWLLKIEGLFGILCNVSELFKEEIATTGHK